MFTLGISATEDGCAPSLGQQERVVAGGGAQRTARPTLRFMESLHGSATAHRDHEPRRIPLTRPSGTLSPSGGEGLGEGVRFMESSTKSIRGMGNLDSAMHLA